MSSSKVTLSGAVAAPDRKKINEEWIELHNESDAPFNTEGCRITAGKTSVKARPSVVATLKAGLVLQPGERVRLVSGSAGKSSQGEPPAEAEGLRNYHLFLKAGYLAPGVVVSVVTRQQTEVCKGVCQRA